MQYSWLWSCLSRNERQPVSLGDSELQYDGKRFLLQQHVTLCHLNSAPTTSLQLPLYGGQAGEQAGLFLFLLYLQKTPMQPPWPTPLLFEMHSSREYEVLSIPGSGLLLTAERGRLHAVIFVSAGKQKVGSKSSCPAYLVLCKKWGEAIWKCCYISLLLFPPQQMGEGYHYCDPPRGGVAGRQTGASSIHCLSKSDAPCEHFRWPHGWDIAMPQLKWKTDHH